MLSHLFPKSKFYLPLFFKNNRYFISKRISFISFIIISIILINVRETFLKMGSVENITSNIVKFIPNHDLVNDYESLELKPLNDYKL